MKSLIIAALFAAAQPAPEGPRSDTPEAQRMLSMFSRCAVMRNRAGVRRFLQLIPGSNNWSNAGSRVATRDCRLDPNLRFQPTIYRGALYEALYKAEYASRPLPDIAAAPAVNYADARPSSLNAPQQAWLALQSFGDCVVRAAPAAARTLVMTDVTTPPEGQAFGALMPSLGPCLPGGMELRFSRPVLRGLVSESLYRLTAASLRARPARS
jgi:hypothetical protein